MKTITKIENNMSSGKSRVAAYCRVSTDMADQLESLEVQKAHYERIIRDDPEWVFTGVYFDEGISGTKKEKRPALISLIEACENGQIDLILTKSISRFARNTTDCLELVRKLRDIGVHIYFERENINTGDMEGELMLTILSSMAEEESVSISKNARWSIQKRFESGTYKIAYPPYGYRNNDGVMEIIPDEAEAVKYIFSEFLSGMSTQAIAKELQEHGIRTKRGGRWQRSTILGILKNEKYTGDVLLQKTWTDDRFNRHINLGDVTQYLIPEHHEPIISHETFDAAQKLMAHHFSEKGGEWKSDKYQTRYLFTSRIICSECGQPMRRKQYPRQGGKHIMWACQTHIDDKEECSMRAVEQEALETAVMTMLNKLTFARNIVFRPFVNSLASAGDDDYEIGRLEMMMEDNSERRVKLSELFRSGLIDADFYNEENNSLLADYRQLNRDFADIRGKHREAEERLASAEDLLRYLNRRDMSGDFDGAAFDEFISEIIVYSQHEFGIKLKCGPEFREVV